ncbi:MAG: LamG domain-containing protein [Gammaproteobacteria bacterium]|nr:LamG domain-containing protein [Gammaproteobacteria bacterium]
MLTNVVFNLLKKGVKKPSLKYQYTASLLDPFQDNSGLALFPLDGNALNVSGVNHGEDLGVSYVNGVVGLSGNFDGTVNRIKLVQGVFGDPATDFSTSCWFKTNNVYQHATFLNFGGQTNGWAVGIYEGKIRLGLRGGGLTFGETSFVIEPDTWYHVIATREVNTDYNKLYVNGKLVSDFTGIFKDGTNQDSIGGSPQSPLTGTEVSTYYVGLIDQVRIFNRPLNDSEALALFLER